MPVCPNCGRETARTEDWACQYCGYPLMSRSFKKVDKNYRQLKGKKQPEPEPPESESPEEEEADVSPPPAFSVPPAPVSKARPLSKTPRAPVARVNPEPPPEPETELEPELEAPPVAELKTEPPPMPAAEVKLTSEPASPVSVWETKSEVVREPEPPSPPIDLTVEELLSAYETGVIAANAHLIGKTVNLTGVVDKIEVKEFLNVYYVALNSPEKVRVQNVRCTFDRRDASELTGLTAGQTVTVRGKYDGSIMDVRIKDCVLVR
ncbi:MAG: hypothetical protein HY529_02910 [Chloroflexi bacterium]|nr:hypothetical protein [Chloroflexota bacterium]